MKTNEKFLSFYYRNMKEIPDIHLDLKKTALLIVDMQKHFIAKDATMHCSVRKPESGMNGNGFTIT